MIASLLLLIAPLVPSTEATPTLPPDFALVSHEMATLSVPLIALPYDEWSYCLGVPPGTNPPPLPPCAGIWNIGCVTQVTNNWWTCMNGVCAEMCPMESQCWIDHGAAVDAAVADFKADLQLAGRLLTGCLIAAMGDPAKKAACRADFNALVDIARADLDADLAQANDTLNNCLGNVNDLYDIGKNGCDAIFNASIGACCVQ